MVNGIVATDLKEALIVRAQGNYTPYGGGTDLMIKSDRNARYLFLHKVPEMKRIVEDDRYIRIGSSCTFTEVLQNPKIPQLLKEAVSQIAAPAIRNLGTIGGNIGNGSAKADSALIFFVSDSLLRLASVRGERVLPIKDFYLGRKKLALSEDELIVEVLMPKKGLDNYYYKKIGARDALAISRVSFAALLEISEGIIRNCATAFGAVTEVVFRRPDFDALLIGKTLEEAKHQKDSYLAAYEKALVPIQGRISAEYRKVVCMNLLKDFLEKNGI